MRTTRKAIRKRPTRFANIVTSGRTREAEIDLLEAVALNNKHFPAIALGLGMKQHWKNQHRVARLMRRISALKKEGTP